MTDQTACVIYVAKSTKDRHLSIPEQLDDCREMARENGWTILGEHADENFTAYTGNRGPGLAAAIDQAKRAAADRGGQVMLVARREPGRTPRPGGAMARMGTGECPRPHGRERFRHVVVRECGAPRRS